MQQFSLKSFSALVLLAGSALLINGCGVENKLASQDVGGKNTPASSTAQGTSAKRYVINDKMRCESARFTCKAGESAFFDELGCGCAASVAGEEPDLVDVGDKVCTTEVAPVCGELQIQCIKAPCLPIKQTFANRCEAQKLNVLNIIDGACADAREVSIAAPVQEAFVQSPVVITGRAVGNWFFEGVFLAQITDAKGGVLGQGQMKAKTDWTVASLVDFSGTVTFNKSTTPTGFIVLRNDNPSGLPENAKVFTWPVQFKP